MINNGLSELKLKNEQILVLAFQKKYQVFPEMRFVIKQTDTLIGVFLKRELLDFSHQV